jgi:hypothetical protein
MKIKMTDLLNVGLSMLPTLMFGVLLGVMLGMAFYLIFWVTVNRGLLLGRLTKKRKSKWLNC